ncbi:amino acid/amide ABC transporter ATP-binding protein 2 (HAAT family) [Sphaerotilus hippei]|uniref:Amino acid/amide ABC transporter ATP-binding protein 2 (HAAT family) n=1 Tax=Sphaerotilus hippei TaxID=744406 RepID=A0A318H360_9BURK|nr:ABC transporter ATP-binding protein [Sphaerotilus hippei]PXW97995.1 amino acid/amide ABC transporter ATP-binding protein 2 (HAAT family) [Sphaerotilus hippei]
MLTVRQLHAGHGLSRVLHGVDFEVAPGEIVSLLGRNGSGRSTTLQALMGLLPAQGSVRWAGRELLGLRPFEIARAGLGYVPEQRDIFARLTVEQNLLLGEQPGRPRRRPPRWTMASLYALFPALLQRRHTAAGVLSGGEQQMLALARTLMGDPDVMLVDEPTEGLAPRVVDQVAAALSTLRERGVAVLLVEQKLTLALDLADRCLLMGHGRIVYSGSSAALRADAALRREWLEV